jgi:hypothetical protein
MDRKTRDWPVAPIAIIDKRLKKSSVALSYSYSVGNEVYGGCQEFSYDFPADAENSIASQLRCFARYDPERPDRAWIPKPER